jgi:uncharacterized protein YdeI (YjbR/CyaY-like superfamily)
LITGHAADWTHDRTALHHGARQHSRWVAEAKRDATKADRVAKTVQRLRAGIKPPGQ